MSRAFVFPGQGAQTIGMGRALAEAYPAARAVFDEVDEALGKKLSAKIPGCKSARRDFALRSKMIAELPSMPAVTGQPFPRFCYHGPTIPGSTRI